MAFQLQSAKARTLNSITATFTEPPIINDPQELGDASIKSQWSVTAISPFGAQERLVQYVEPGETSLEITVFVDGALQDQATYLIEVNEAVESTQGNPIDPAANSALFVALKAGKTTKPVEAQNERIDLSNPQVEQDLHDANQPLGTFQVTSKGSYALESGAPYLRKRIIRRATTAFGQYFHLPEYGFAEPIKGLITASALARIQARASAQILSEPDVATANVAAYQLPDSPHIVALKIAVTTRDGSADIFTVPVEVASEA